MGSRIDRREPFLAPGAMDAATCRLVRASMDAGQLEAAEVFAADVEARPDVRRACSVDVPDAVLDVVSRHLDAQRPAIGAFFGRALVAREGPGLIRYEPGGFYRRHVDRAGTAAWPAGARRAVTMVLFLASARQADPAGAFSGGHLRLYPDDTDTSLEVVPVQGMLVAFPADLPHEVTPVTAGRRDAVVDWLYDA